MTLNDSGNLGLGVTPSAWATSFSQKAIQFSDKSALSADTNTATLSQNAVKLAGGWTYLASTYALRYDINNSAGTHAWFTAPSGTAGNAISFTQAMTLDASGNLGVGTTSPAARITSAVANSGTNQLAFSATNTTNADFNAWIATSYTMIGPSSATPLAFATGATERARIDSSGNLLVGTTSAIAKVTVYGTTGNCASFQNDSGATRFPVLFYNGVTNVGNIATSTSTTSYNTGSDYRLKNITGPITTSGAYIDSLNPVEGTWKADGSTFVGLIAHEVQEASRTNVATGVKDGEEMQGMDYSSAEIIANLIAEVKSLRQRLAAAGI
jgi:hypothetical protein